MTTVGVLAAAVFCVLAPFTMATAEWDESAPGTLIGSGCLALPSDPNGGLFYDRSGEAWVVGPASAWSRKAEYDLPVEPREVKFLDTDNAGTALVTIVVVTTTDVVWGYVGFAPTGHWENFGTFPGGPVSTSSRSWGNVKGTHRAQDSGR